MTYGDFMMIKIKNKKSLFAACLIALLSLISLQKYGHWIAGLDINSGKRLQNFFEYFMQPFTYVNVFAFFAMAYIIFKLLDYTKQTNAEWKINKVTTFFNVIYVLALSLAISFGEIESSNSVNLYLNNNWGVLVFLLKVIGVACTSYLLIVALEQKIYSQPSYNTVQQNDIAFKWWKWFLFILICWLPYIIILYPAAMNADTINQLNEFFGHGNWVHDDYPIGWYLLQGHNNSISNQHNFFLTLFYGFNFKIGLKLFNRPSIGLFLSSFEQILSLCGVFTYSLTTFHRLNMPNTYINKFKLFFAFFPLFPITCMFLTKNIFYSICFMWSILLIVNVMYKPQAITYKWWLCYILSVLGQLVTEKYAIYIIILISLLILIFEWKTPKIKKLSMTMILVAIIFIGGQHLLFNKLGVPNGDPIESKSVMIQSTALYNKQYPEDISAYQKRVLNKVFVLKNLNKLYIPGFSDPIKSSGGKKIGLQSDGKFNQYLSKKWIEGYRYQSVTERDIKKYNSVWLQLMKKHPKVLFQAFMEQGYGYLDIFYRQSDSSVVAPSDSFNVSSLTGTIPVGKKLVVVKSPVHFAKIRKIFAILFSSLVKLPPFMVLLSGTILISVTVIEWLVLLRLRLYKQSFLWLSFLMQVPIFMLSPVNGNQRYMYPFVLFSGVFFGLFVLCMYQYKKSK